MDVYLFYFWGRSRRNDFERGWGGWGGAAWGGALLWAGLGAI